MDFLSLLGTYGDGLIQLGYVIILIFAAVKLLPDMIRNHAQDRKSMLEMIKERDEKFFSVIEGYEDTLERFQFKEIESHRELVEMIKDCRSKVAAEHMEIMRALKTIAQKIDTDIID